MAEQEEKVEFDDLLVNIKSTRNVNEIKRKLEQNRWTDARDDRRGKERSEAKGRKRGKKATTTPAHRRQNEEEEEEADELEAAMEKQRMDRQRKVLEAPIHRQAQQRIEGKLAYRQTKLELRQWQPIVDGLRVAEQLQFPHDERTDDPLRSQTAEERVKGFVPRTELEQRIAEVLGRSKSTIGNDQEFSQAEREVLKAMDLKEAKLKCAELRKMRALMSFHAAKMKRQSKIKSKLFHRVRKRQKNRELVKEVETMLVSDPAKAAERIEELEKDRAYERATLKHRGTNKWTKQVRKFASRNPALHKTIEDQLRLGRELKSKRHEGVVDSSDDDSAGEEAGEEQLSTQKLVQMAADEAAKESGQPMPKVSENPFYRGALEQIRKERKEAQKKAKQRGAAKAGAERAAGNDKNKEDELKKDGRKVEGGRAVQPEEPEFLDLNLRKIAQIPVELTGEADSETDVGQAFLAEAYEDDEVLEDFRARKDKASEEEKPKAGQSRYSLMRGWGAWTGQGIPEEREKRRMNRLFGQEPRKKALKRKDSRLGGVIIHERVGKAIEKLQPRDVPFPFTRCQDFEAYVQQPLGQDWNTPLAHQQLVQPQVLTKAGRVIHPLKKGMKLKSKMLLEEMTSDGK